MSRLLALYPRAWRSRYGDEFSDLLEARPPSLRDLLDIVIGAVDARINPQVPGADERERSVAGDRSARVIAIVAGVMFTIWGVIGATAMVPWESNLAPRAPAELMNLAWLTGLLGSLLAPVVFGIVIARYERILGAAGVAGALLTPAGLIMSALGMGLLALLALAVGVILFCWRANGRILSTPVAIAFAAGALFAVAGFLVFAAGDGQDVNVLLPMVGLGPSWIAFGLGLRQPHAMPDSSSSPTPSLADA
jgi:MFS family permease